jgi:anti-sigma regulatory factor (Ser/Thr protein kinase)
MARRSGVNEEYLDEIRLAVGEACARAVRRHNRQKVDEPVTVEFSDKGRFSVSVIDSAPGTPTEPWEPTSDGLVGGPEDLAGMDLGTWADPTAEALGLALLGAVVQDMTVTDRPDSDGSRLTMSWPLET